MGEVVAGGEGGVFSFGGLRRFGDGFSTGAVGISGFELAVFLFSHNREVVRLNPISRTVLITHLLLILDSSGRGFILNNLIMPDCSASLKIW